MKVTEYLSRMFYQLKAYFSRKEQETEKSGKLEELLAAVREAKKRADFEMFYVNSWKATH